MAPPLAALTGATGFLGGQVALALAEQGWRLRLLVRGELVDPQVRALAPEIVRGGLAEMEALSSLCRGVDAVVHVAGIVKARDLREFEAVNGAGAGRMAAAARQAAPHAGFLLVSSLAARAPQLSPYARSKRQGETAVTEALDGGACIVRPPAIYGPGDRATLGLFRAAALSPVLPTLRPAPRLPLIHVRDAASMIATAAGAPPAGRTLTLCDGRPDGYDLEEIVRQAALAVGRRPRLVRVPAAAIRAAGLAGDAARRLGAPSMLTSGKVRELLDGDWRLAAGEIVGGLPAARFGLADGFDDTVAGYRAAGWLAPPRR